MDNYKRIFQESKLKQVDVSRITGASISTLQQMEKGEANPTVRLLTEFASKLSSVFQISIIDFFSISQLSGSRYYRVIEKGSDDYLLNKDILDENDRLKDDLLSEKSKRLHLYERLDGLKEENDLLINQLEMLKAKVEKL